MDSTISKIYTRILSDFLTDFYQFNLQMSLIQTDRIRVLRPKIYARWEKNFWTNILRNTLLIENQKKNIRVLYFQKIYFQPPIFTLQRQLQKINGISPFLLHISIIKKKLNSIDLLSTCLCFQMTSLSKIKKMYKTHTNVNISRTTKRFKKC